MTREDIIRMASEVGMRPNMTEALISELVHFAALVAAAEREKVAQWMLNHSYATGHGDTTEDLLKELDWQIRESEREACAKVCEEEICECCWDKDAQAAAEHIAASIRARGK